MENTKKYDVTLVITTYNEEKYLPILLDSIKNQNTHLSIEVIIVDDSSTDSTLKIAEESGHKIIHNDRKSEVDYMRNLGLDNANGEVVIFCDADIALSKNYIERMVSPIIENKVDTTLCKTYAILEAFYNVVPSEYSKSYLWFLNHFPKFIFKRFPVQFFPWLKLWIKNMKDKKKYLSLWTIPNRSHTTGIATRSCIAKSFGGWTVRIGDGDDAKYSSDVFSKSDRIMWVKKSVLYISRRRVFPKNASWISDIFFKSFKKSYQRYIKRKDDNDYTNSIR